MTDEHLILVILDHMVAQPSHRKLFKAIVTGAAATTTVLTPADTTVRRRPPPRITTAPARSPCVVRLVRVHMAGDVLDVG